MNRHISCYKCEHTITEHGNECVECSNFFQKKVLYCQRCFVIEHKKLEHKSIPIDYTETTNFQLINSIIDFEKLHLSTTMDKPKLFPYDDQDSVIWKSNHFLEISYQLPSEVPFKSSIPFVCDYLRMNNSLKYLGDKLNLKLCSTDMVILILKYSSFDIRLFIIEQLCTFQRPIPIYFGAPDPENLSLTHYFLMHEMLHMLLPYKYQNLPFILSFGTDSCKEKTLLLNAILKTNFDCRRKGEFNFESASTYHQNQLIQMVLGHQYGTDRSNYNEITRRYQCHVLDLHGTHEWNKMPNFFVEFMSVIIIHIDKLDIDQIDSFKWPFVTYNKTAIYLIFVHGEISDSDTKIKLQSQIQKYFGSNNRNVHIYRANAILIENDKTLQLGLLSLLKQAPSPKKSLLDVSEQLIQQHNLNLSTNISTLLNSKQLLDEFHTILENLSKDDPSLDLFPLSRLKELSEKTILSHEDEQQKRRLVQQLNSHTFDHAHILLTKLVQLYINDDNQMVLFEKAILLWNTILWQRIRNESERSPVSKLEHLKMSKECFLREFQERSKGYTNLNGRHCLFKDTDQMKTALMKIYRHLFRSQEYIEIINATSPKTYPDIFHQTFSNNFEGMENFFVIGIIGEQSGGKSFLVNKAFGTKVAESKFKCTTGILATRVTITGHENVKNIIILDTEGLLDQSKKDGQAQIFDRKIVLAVMARSHVVMVNITRNVNKTMQKILEIVFYGLNKLQITRKPKMIFLFRDQDPKTMGEAGQRNHVSEVMKDIEKDCEKVNFNMQNIINGFDIHEFPSPFVDLLVGEREISFFNNSFCQKALSLRLKVIDHLATLKPYNSFNEWLGLMLELWQQINHNSNLFDYESLVHLTLERDLETFCNRVLTDANQQMREIVENFRNNGRNKTDGIQIIHEIEQKLLEKKTTLTNDLSEQLSNEKRRLIQKHNLESFPEGLYENTELRIKSDLNLYKTDRLMAVTRQFQQDEFQKKLSEIPKDLSNKIREIQNVSENTGQFETLFNDTSTTLLKNFIHLVENDYREQSKSLNKKLIQNFVEQNRIDDVGVVYFRQNIGDSHLEKTVRQAVQRENSDSVNYRSPIPATANAISLVPGGSNIALTYQHGSGILRNLAWSIWYTFFSKKKSNNNEEQQQFEKMLSFLRVEYTALQNGPYYDSNLLPIPELANYCVEHIRKAIEDNNIKNQDVRNMWYTCYGIMLNLFCDKHYNYINKKLISEFEQEISRRKEEVKQNIANATTAEEQGEAWIKQIWTIIENDIQKQCQNQFERFFATCDDYHPSIISENCVNQLFRSINYQAMFNYIQDPTAYIKHWVRLRFNEKYQSQLQRTILNLSSHLDDNKMKFSRIILTWHNAIQASNFSVSVLDLTDSLKVFLLHGKYTKNKISLTEPTSGFSTLDFATIRTIPSTADKDRLLKAILSTSKTILTDNNERVKKSTKILINNEQLKNRLFDQFYNRAKGCGTPCPYCKQICDDDNPMHTEHRTDHHLLWTFAGYRERYTQKPSLICCTSNEAFKRKVESLIEKETYTPFPEHLRRFNPTWKIINQMRSLQNFLLKAYIALEEDLARYYKFNGRADIAIRKKYLRATVTTHCYGLLVGIDYENTPNSLGGIPSYDVSCIEQQLNLSSIAYPENLHIIKNNQATKENILTKLNTMMNNMDERSTFIFYFSGHGGRTQTSVSYLLTVDNQRLTANELVTVLGKAKTNKMIIMLDSCYSGGMGNAFRFDLNNYTEGIHILCSSSQTQVSYQLARDKNGFFTKYLIKGLKGEFSCEVNNCNECATRTNNLQWAPIHKVTSTELVTYLNHAVTRRQHFTYTAVNGRDFDISFPAVAEFLPSRIQNFVKQGSAYPTDSLALF